MTGLAGFLAKNLVNFHDDEPVLELVVNGRDFGELAGQESELQPGFPHDCREWEARFSGYPALEEIYERYNSVFDRENGVDDS